MMDYSMYVAEQAKRLEACSQRVTTLFSSLTEHQLNWKPAPASWSVAQCLEHLIISNRLYYDDIEAIASDRYIMNGYLRMPILPSFFGWMLKYSLKRPAMKSKTVQRFEPSESHISLSIISDFALHNEELAAKIRTIQHKDLQALVVRSAFADKVIYSAYDLLSILTIHEERHIAQAERVMKATGFP